MTELKIKKAEIDALDLDLLQKKWNTFLARKAIVNGVDAYVEFRYFTDFLYFIFKDCDNIFSHNEMEQILNEKKELFLQLSDVLVKEKQSTDKQLNRKELGKRKNWINGYYEEDLKARRDEIKRLREFTRCPCDKQHIFGRACIDDDITTIIKLNICGGPYRELPWEDGLNHLKALMNQLTVIFSQCYGINEQILICKDNVKDIISVGLENMDIAFSDFVKVVYSLDAEQEARAQEQYKKVYSSQYDDDQIMCAFIESIYYEHNRRMKIDKEYAEIFNDYSSERKSSFQKKIVKN